MLYVIIGTDNPNTLDLRTAHRPLHVARLQELKEQGRLIIAGPNPLIDAKSMDYGCSGSVIIAEFASLIEAKTWANNDPYLLNGIYQTVEVRPFIKAFP